MGINLLSMMVAVSGEKKKNNNKKKHFFPILLIFLVSILAQVANFFSFPVNLFQVLFVKLTISKNAKNAVPLTYKDGST